MLWVGSNNPHHYIWLQLFSNERSPLSIYQSIHPSAKHFSATERKQSRRRESQDPAGAGSKSPGGGGRFIRRPAMTFTSWRTGESADETCVHLMVRLQEVNPDGEASSSISRLNNFLGGKVSSWQIMPHLITRPCFLLVVIRLDQARRLFYHRCHLCMSCNDSRKSLRQRADRVSGLKRKDAAGRGK